MKSGINQDAGMRKGINEDSEMTRGIMHDIRIKTLEIIIQDKRRSKSQYKKWKGNDFYDTV